MGNCNCIRPEIPEEPVAYPGGRPPAATTKAVKPQQQRMAVVQEPEVLLPGAVPFDPIAEATEVSQVEADAITEVPTEDGDNRSLTPALTNPDQDVPAAKKVEDQPPVVAEAPGPDLNEIKGRARDSIVAAGNSMNDEEEAVKARARAVMIASAPALDESSSLESSAALPEFPLGQLDVEALEEPKSPALEAVAEQPVYPLGEPDVEGMKERVRASMVASAPPLDESSSLEESLALPAGAILQSDAEEQLSMCDGSSKCSPHFGRNIAHAQFDSIPPMRSHTPSPAPEATISVDMCQGLPESEPTFGHLDSEIDVGAEPIVSPPDGAPMTTTSAGMPDLVPAGLEEELSLWTQSELIVSESRQKEDWV